MFDPRRKDTALAVDSLQNLDQSRNEVLVDIEDLHVDIHTRSGTFQVLNGVDLRIGRGESVGLVGESGSGKSLTCLAVMGLLPKSADVASGRITFNGKNLLAESERDLRRIRGRDIGMILQDPMSSLNPTLTVGHQVNEPIREHLGLLRSKATERTVELLSSVQIPEAAARAKGYPHEMSGGMRQRVVGAIAISCNPSLLIADEPTTSLDVTIQAQYLSLLRRIQAETGCALLLVTHDLAVVSATCDRLAVMYAGRIVEFGPAADVLSEPRHPYTRGLLSSLPNLAREPGERLSSIRGQPPDPGEAPPGCSFASRCDYAISECSAAVPPFVWHDQAHGSACIRMTGADPLDLSKPINGSVS